MAITYALSGGTSIQDLLGNGHIVFGSITVTAGANAVVTSNDASLSVVRNASGDYTMTFGEPFVSIPYAHLQPLRTTFATSSAVTVEVYAASTSAISFNVVTNTTAGTVTALGELADVHFIVVGKRLN